MSNFVYIEGVGTMKNDSIYTKYHPVSKLGSWKMFLDDLRYPHAKDFIIARSSADAIWMIDQYGMPVYIAFDHDLGGTDTSIKLIDWIIEKVLDGNLIIPDFFEYSIHSANPVGAGNIRGKLDPFLRYIGVNHE